MRRFRLGDLTVSALLDGELATNDGLFAGSTIAELGALKTRAFLDPGPVRLPVNVYAIEGPRGLTLIDAGSGTAMGPDAGHLADSLRAAGLDPASVGTVLLTHLHADHSPGLLGPGAQAMFPSAEIVLAAAERAYWFDEGNFSRASAEARPSFLIARASIQPYAARTRLFEGDGEVLPGITAVGLPGHTPGHTGYLVSSGGRDLLIWGDIVHVGAFQFPRPDISIAYDVDAAAARATRARIMDRAASERLLVAGMHVDFPGFGHLRREGAGYDFIPAPFRRVL
ncbi:MAG: MBL fold metallo-hydrolase [Gemmatimonadaceae bacterium]|nr:MBL fold metallo-hydrolase [Acetobacteraceae bacterium]